MGATGGWFGSGCCKIVTAVADTHQALAIVAVDRGIAAALTASVALSTDACRITGGEFRLRGASQRDRYRKCDKRNGRDRKDRS